MLPFMFHRSRLNSLRGKKGGALMDERSGGKRGKNMIIYCIRGDGAADGKGGVHNIRYAMLYCIWKCSE
jgi:hypothetical protein